MKITHSQIQKLSILGYQKLPGSEPPVFVGGGQFTVGIWEISESQALTQLEQAENMNKVWLKRFGKKLYKI
jgi:hypothetical protein